MAFRIVSSAFADGEHVPSRYTCEGDDSPPPLELEDPPAAARSFALIMDDPDAPRGTFTHWLAFDIPPGSATLRADAAKSLANSFGKRGYGGPCPPPGHGPHRYYFTVYAVDVPALDVRGTDRSALEAALEGHTLARARLMGRFERTR